MNVAARVLARKLGWVALLSLAIAASASGAGNTQQSTSRDFQKTLQLGPNQTVTIEHKFGEIRLHGEGGRDVHISATIHTQANTEQEAQKFADDIRIDVSQDANGVHVKTIYPDEHSWVIRIGKGPSYSVDYDITVPSDAKLWIKNGFGNVDIRGVNGWAEVENNHGQLAFRDGGSMKLTNSFGSVETSGAEGDVAIVNNNGVVTVSAVKGAVDVKDRFAAITVSNVQGGVTISGGNGKVELTDVGKATVNNSFGAVTARNVHGTLTINNNNGGIDVNTVNGTAYLSGSFGAITFANVSGYVKCTATNGKVKGGPTGDEVYVKTSFGDVELDQISGAVDVEDSNGNITVREVKGHANFNTSFGSIEASDLRKGARATTGNGRIVLNDVGGDTFAKTSFGAVNIQRVNGHLTIENSNGAVNANSVKGDATAKTSFGAVSLEDVGGAISVDNQNGSVAVATARVATGCKPIMVKTSFAPIEVRIPEGMGFNINAKTSFGHISSDLPITTSGQIGGDSLNGKIGNGGCALSLTNSNGSIGILKR